MIIQDKMGEVMFHCYSVLKIGKINHTYFCSILNDLKRLSGTWVKPGGLKDGGKDWKDLKWQLISILGATLWYSLLISSNDSWSK